MLATLYVTVMIMGHNLFGDNCQSNILLNFANSDPLAVGGRVATALSIVFGYPLAFAGLIDGIKGTCKSLLSEGTTLGGSLAAMTDPANETALRVGLLGLATAIALAVNGKQYGDCSLSIRYLSVIYPLYVAETRACILKRLSC